MWGWILLAKLKLIQILGLNAPLKKSLIKKYPRQTFKYVDLVGKKETQRERQRDHEVKHDTKENETISIQSFDENIHFMVFPSEIISPVFWHLCLVVWGNR